MKRKEWIAVLAVCGLMSCSKTQVREPMTPSPLRFSGFVQKTTRGQAFLGNKLSQPFRVSAFAVAPGETLDPERLEYVMSEQLVTTADGGNTFQYAPLMFFPFQKELICCAYTPATIENAEFYPTPGQSDFPMLSVQIPTDVSEQKDIMVAYAKGVNALNSVNGINLNFVHALTQITFAARTTQSNLKIVIKSIQLENVNDQGVCAFNTVSQMSEVFGEVNYIQTFDGTLGEVYYDNPGYKTLTTSANAMLLLPQNLVGKKMSVTYDAYIKLPGHVNHDTKIAQNETKTVDLSGKWDAGMAYRYELSIQPGTPLNFQTTVNTWIEGTTPAVF